MNTTEGQPGRFARTVKLWDEYRKGSNRSGFGTLPLEQQLFGQYIVGMWMIEEMELLEALQAARIQIEAYRSVYPMRGNIETIAKVETAIAKAEGNLRAITSTENGAEK